jgi:hypothetical protein
MGGPNQFIHSVVCSTTHRPDGTVEVAHQPAMWVLAHRGYSGSGRLALWGYPSQQAALYAGAELALECGFDDDPHAVDLFEVGQFTELLAYYKQKSPNSHLLRVQPAFVQIADVDELGADDDLPPFAALFGQGRRHDERHDEDDEVRLTARDAAVLWDCAVQCAAEAGADVETFGDEPVRDDLPEDDERFWLIFDDYPALTFAQDAAWRRQARHAFLDLAADLAGGVLPLPRCPAEEMALHLILNAAEDWGEDIEPDDGDMLLANLPADAEDHDWEKLRDTLFRDHDILTLYDPVAAGIEDPADPRNRAITMGDYRPSAWFTWFASAQPRDPNRRHP